MPNNPRQEYKRKLDYAIRDIDNALVLVADVAETYRPVHPDIADALDIAGAGLIATNEHITAIMRSI